jgi:hypothetical protein
MRQINSAVTCGNKGCRQGMVTEKPWLDPDADSNPIRAVEWRHPDRLFYPPQGWRRCH